MTASLKEQIKYWSDRIFGIKSSEEFNDLALEIFHFQYKNNLLYKRFADLSCSDPSRIDSIFNIPYLPVEFFKNQKIISGNMVHQRIFVSSGTSAGKSSKHYIVSKELYEQSFLTNFKRYYKEPNNTCILGLLPSYLERKESSLVYMINKMIELSGHPDSGFYLYNYSDLSNTLMKNQRSGSRMILFGVSFALLDFVEEYSFEIPDLIVIETGGMKGRKKEMLRSELHKILSERFNVINIHSEYGMTEMLSQAYSIANGKFESPPWMMVLIRDLLDPFEYLNANETGVINIIDLANVFSCSFIATQDLGLIHPDNTFEVLGRTDNSDIRGCSLLLT